MKNRRAEDPAQVDRAWTGYHPRAAMPTLTIAVVASLLIWTGRWYLNELSELADRVGALMVFALAWCVWPLLIALYLYRAVTYTYRLTDRAVLIDFGFWYRPISPVWLSQITEIRTGGDWPTRWLGIGWVEVQTTDRSVRLVGIRNARAFAEQIRVVVKNATSGIDEQPASTSV